MAPPLLLVSNSYSSLLQQNPRRDYTNKWRH
ncbi:hypothetical protein Golob_028097 [Gossypium lobatum]|uniref:Uncharacterized protein n=1 Tax=Gossypium lobatum TaxID=34289 RepID=A0A7J8NIL4_9ROSI|nr:hypothetical protein [Gossypium lobatum]